MELKTVLHYQIGRKDIPRAAQQGSPESEGFN